MHRSNNAVAVSGTSTQNEGTVLKAYPPRDRARVRRPRPDAGPAMVLPREDKAMKQPPHDQSLLNLWRAGNQDAARQLFDRYSERLVALARRHISHRLARRIDPEDVVQSVFRTFFRRAKSGELNLYDPDRLCALLARITINKALDQVSFHRAAKRDMNLDADSGSNDNDPVAQVLDHEPSPDAINQFLDQLEHFLGHFGPEERQVLEMRMHGFTVEEIARRLNTYDRKIYRILERARALAEQVEKSS
jgi:RNA polymerase sigma factor (sigma-70 family)